MKTVLEYRDHASDCRALARKARNEEERMQLLKMAATWDGLASEREQLLAAQHPSEGPVAPKKFPYLARSH